MLKSAICDSKPTKTKSIALLLLLFLSFLPFEEALSQEIRLARLRYQGGGDWYNDPSALQNLLTFANAQMASSISLRYDDVDLGSSELFRYPFAFITGHGGLKYSPAEVEQLRSYLVAGGFLYIDDDYGFDSDIRALIKALFPEESLIELPFEHPIYTFPYRFESGLPKVHEHDGKDPEGLGLFYKGRMVLFYSYESNLADGWANPEVHKNPEAIRQAALKMGVNLLMYAINGG